MLTLSNNLISRMKLKCIWKMLAIFSMEDSIKLYQVVLKILVGLYLVTPLLLYDYIVKDNLVSGMKLECIHVGHVLNWLDQEWHKIVPGYIARSCWLMSCAAFPGKSLTLWAHHLGDVLS